MGSQQEYSCAEALAARPDFRGCPGARGGSVVCPGAGAEKEDPQEIVGSTAGGAGGGGGGGGYGISSFYPGGGFRSKILTMLQGVRAPLAEYQETRGLCKTESYTFVNLISSLCSHAYEAAITIVTMLYNLLPLLEGFLYFVRFVLDRLIEICLCENTTEMALKGMLLLGQLLLVILLIMTITSFIIVPVWTMLRYLLSKSWGLLQ